MGFPSQRGEILLEGGSPMAETRREFDADFREGAVRLVREAGKPVARSRVTSGSTRARWATGSRWTGGAGTTRAARWAGTRGRSWRGCGGRTPSCRCGVMCSSAAWPSGSPARWAAGSRGRVHRRPEGRPRRPARGGLPRAGGVPVVVLQAEGRGAAAAGRAAAAAGSRGRAAVRGAEGQGRGAADHRRAARGRLAGQRERRRGPDAPAAPGRPAALLAEDGLLAQAEAAMPRRWTGSAPSAR